MGTTKNRIYMTHIQITDMEKRVEMITLNEETKDEEFKAILEILEVKKKRWQNITTLGVFEVEIPTKRQKRS